MTQEVTHREYSGRASNPPVKHHRWASSQPVNTTARAASAGLGRFTETKAGFETTETIMMLAVIMVILIATYVADADVGGTRAGGTSRGWRPHAS